jgi:hypothetical protein
MGLRTDFSADEPSQPFTATDSSVNLAPALVSSSEAKRRMKQEGEKDLSPKAVESWQYKRFAGWTGSFSKFEASARSKGLQDMAKEVMDALENDGDTSTEVSGMVKFHLQYLLKDRDHLAFRRGWDRQLSLKSLEKARSVCESVGLTLSDDGDRISEFATTNNS